MVVVAVGLVVPHEARSAAQAMKENSFFIIQIGFYAKNRSNSSYGQTLSIKIRKCGAD